MRCLFTEEIQGLGTRQGDLVLGFSEGEETKITDNIMYMLQCPPPSRLYHCFDIRQLVPPPSRLTHCFEIIPDGNSLYGLLKGQLQSIVGEKCQGHSPRTDLLGLIYDDGPVSTNDD